MRTNISLLFKFNNYFFKMDRFSQERSDLRASQVSGGGAGGPRLMSYNNPGPQPGVKSHNQPYRHDGGQFNNRDPVPQQPYEDYQGISGGACENLQDFEESKLEHNFSQLAVNQPKSSLHE